MHVIRHDDEFIQFDGWETVGKLLPCAFNDMTHLKHLKVRFAPLQACSHEIGSWLAIIIAFKAKRTPVMFFRVISHRYYVPSRGMVIVSCISLYFYTDHNTKCGNAKCLSNCRDRGWVGNGGGACAVLLPTRCMAGYLNNL